MGPGASSAPAPDGGAVHLWWLDLEREWTGAGLLSADERERAGRLRGERDRQAFVASRAALRVLLGRYHEVAPRDIRFALGPRGKPSVVGGGDVHFSLSRTAGVALVAVCRGQPVGVDVERIRPVPELQGIARRLLPPADVAALDDLPEPRRLPAFFACWTRTEAGVKATGAGLGDDGARDGPGWGGAGAVEVRDVDAPAGTAAAVAVVGRLGPVTVRHVAGSPLEAHLLDPGRCPSS